MGRRPNAIVADFFDRGAKLEDSSNRYIHTCRRCGDVFPKGRVDHLINHLLKRCENLTQDERNYVLLRTQQSAESKKNEDSINRQAVQPGISHSLQLPVSLERQQSALDTLAEVSRRHLDYSSQRTSAYDQSNILHHAEQALAEQALWAQLQQHNLDVPDTHLQSEAMVPDNQLSQTSVDISHGQIQHDLDIPTSGAEVYDLRAFDSDTSLPPFTTSVYAPAIQVSHDVVSQKTGNLDPQLGPIQAFDTNAPDVYGPAETQDHIRSQASKPAQLQWAAQLTDAIPQHAFKSAAQAKPARSKQRGKFTENRRKEVQEIRKRGACMRCRMLKKPCSEGTPCKTCANVDNARLWKDNCIRTRLETEYQAWTSEYFKTTCQQVLQGLVLGPVSPHRVYIKLDFDPGQGVSSAARLMSKSGSHEYGSARSFGDDVGAMLAVDNAEDLQDKISSYCMSKPIMSEAIKNEPQKFMQTTLLEAIDLLVKDRNEHDDQSKSDTRSCYSIANSMTRDTLELWILTACLVPISGLCSPRFVVNSPDSDTEIKAIIEAQLFAAIETRCSRLSKKVLNDLERRLLQRQQVSGFATYIAAVMFISCVERMTTLYQRFDPTEQHDCPTWPLEGNASARHYWLQGPSFTSLLAMLLRIRGLPPKTYEDGAGMLAMVNDLPEKFVKLNGTATEDQLRAIEEERRAAMSAWLARCNISFAEVRLWTLKSGNDWYGRLMAALLL